MQEIIIVCTGHQWNLLDPETNDFIPTPRLNTGNKLVKYCNKNKLMIINAQSLMPKFREKLNVYEERKL